MSFASHLKGLGSHATYSMDTIMNLCPIDQKPVQIVIDIERLKKECPDLSWYQPNRKSLWRFGGLLAMDYDDPKDREYIVDLGEGYTPLLAFYQYPLAKKLGIKLYIKEEGRAYHGYGANPTQSFKDRGMAMVVAMAKKLGLNKLAVPTQGNAGDSLTEYAIHAGLSIAVVMPDDTPLPILGKVAAYEKMYPNQVKLELVKGTIREAGAYIKEHFVPQGYFSVATFQDPGWRIEGKKTLGLELAEPKYPGDTFNLPDAVIYPTGGGTGILGMWKAFDELQALGLIGDHRPRIYAVQSEVTSPLVEAWRTTAEDTTPVAAGQTIATGLNVPGGVGHFKVLDILRQSDGAAISVSEQAISATLESVFRDAGIWLSPEGAATLAALEPLANQGLIKAGERIVAFNTGSFEKYLPNVRHLLKGRT